MSRRSHQDWQVRARAACYQAHALAARSGVSERELRWYLAGRFGHSSKHWIDKLRIDDACRLLMAGKSTKGAAFQAGFQASLSVLRVLQTHVRNLSFRMAPARLAEKPERLDVARALGVQ